jgi:phosphonate transport system substrate-binding protein
MADKPLRFITFLAPNLFKVYAFIARYVGARLGVATELVVGSAYAEMAAGADVGFICSLPYVELKDRHGLDLEPLVAPVLSGPRYGGRPIYYSDIIVHVDSPWQTFADLRGRSWAYNEPLSHSGYGIMRYRLVQLGESRGYFGRVVEAGWHERAIRLVCSGEVDASAIDSQVLAVALRDQPSLAGRLRVIDTLGPSPIQPIVASPSLSAGLKADLRGVLAEMGEDPIAWDWLAHGFVERLVAVTDATYDVIRVMRAAVEAADFLTSVRVGTPSSS